MGSTGQGADAKGSANKKQACFEAESLVHGKVFMKEVRRGSHADREIAVLKQLKYATL